MTRQCLGWVSLMAFASLTACGAERADVPAGTPRAPSPTARPLARSSASAVAVASSPPPAPATPPVTFTVDDRSVEIVSALALAVEDEVEIDITNFPYGCEELLRGFRSSYPDEVRLQLRLGKQLRPDGSLVWAIRGSYFDGTSSEKQGSGDALPGAVIDTGAGARGPLALGVAHDTLPLGDAPARRLRLEGTVELLGCGARPPPDDRAAPPTPQPGAVITIAGQALAIVGAAFAGSADERTLMLSTSPVTCVKGTSYSASRGDVVIELGWDKTGTLRRAKHDGRWVGWGIVQTGAIGLDATPHAVPPGARETKVELGGSATIGDYSVSLEGTVRAAVCQR